MNPAPMGQNGMTSEDIRKSYPLIPKTLGVFNNMPIGVWSNYDRMQIKDICDNVLFTFEPEDFILMEMRFVRPCYLLIVGGHCICPDRFRVVNLNTQQWQFDYMPLSCGDMMEPCVAIHPTKTIIALCNNDGVDIVDVSQGKTISHIANAEDIAFSKNDDIVYCDYKGVITLQTSTGKNEVILDLSSGDNFFTDSYASNWFNNSNTLLVSPLASDMFQINLDNKKIESLKQLKDEAINIEITPDDKYVNITMFESSYLLDLKTEEEITLEDCKFIDTTYWLYGYAIVMGDRGIRKIDLSSIL